MSIKSLVKGTKTSTMQTCRFCDAQFKYPGSLGRHLDRKRGDLLHPHREVEKERANVRRRSRKKTTLLTQHEDITIEKHIKVGELFGESEMLTDIGTRAYLAAFMELESEVETPRFDPTVNFASKIVCMIPPEAWPAIDIPPGIELAERVKSTLKERIKLYESRIEECKTTETDFFGGLRNNIRQRKRAKLEEVLGMIDKDIKEWLAFDYDERVRLWQHEQLKYPRQAFTAKSLCDFSERAEEIDYKHYRHYLEFVSQVNQRRGGKASMKICSDRAA